jgi:hypothetical protein
VSRIADPSDHLIPTLQRLDGWRGEWASPDLIDLVTPQRPTPDDPLGTLDGVGGDESFAAMVGAEQGGSAWRWSLGRPAVQAASADGVGSSPTSTGEIGSR